MLSEKELKESAHENYAEAAEKVKVLRKELESHSVFLERIKSLRRELLEANNQKDYWRGEYIKTHTHEERRHARIERNLLNPQDPPYTGPEVA